MGHLNFDNLVNLSKKEVVRDLHKIVKPLNSVCRHCQHGKETKASFKTKEHMSSHPLEIFHTDLCGLTRTKILQGEYYFMLLIDDYTRMNWVTFLKEKSEAFEKFKIFKAMVENEINQTIKCLRLDNGGEFTSNEFNDFFEIHGIKIQFSAAKTPWWNGVVERKNRTVKEATRRMLNEAKMSYAYWKEVVYRAV